MGFEINAQLPDALEMAVEPVPVSGGLRRDRGRGGGGCGGGGRGGGGRGGGRRGCGRAGPGRGRNERGRPAPSGAGPRASAPAAAAEPAPPAVERGGHPCGVGASAAPAEATPLGRWFRCGIGRGRRGDGGFGVQNGSAAGRSP